MKHAVIIGAGNIGRGFIGQIFSEAGYEIVFLDVAASLVDALNAAGSYPLELVDSASTERRIIAPVRAVNGRDADAAARTIADADVLVTCVGAKALKYIVPNLVAGVRLRAAGSGKPLNLLICENLMDADAILREWIAPLLTEKEAACLGLVETTVGRMVPLPDKELLEKEPLLARAERYGWLPYDADAWLGDAPDAPALIPYSPFRFMVERKLYVHNMGHAVTAYLGMLRGHTFIADAIADPAIRVAVREAMTASARALAKKDRADLDALIAHGDDLIRRFGNRALGDTCERVGADIPRKLAPTDRLTGAAGCIAAAGMRPVWHALAAAAALVRYEKESGDVIVPAVRFTELTGVGEGDYYTDALAFHRRLREGAPLETLIAEADGMLARYGVV